MKKFILAALAATTIAAALPTVAMADTANTVTVTKFHQSYPYSGRAMVEYTVGGTLPANAVSPTITRKSSAVKVEMTVHAPAGPPRQFFKVKFGE